ncbi:MAG TPA: TIGR04283 family arsenosugar biosynthesis glycosyltransferase [Blastocatellia bacterium]|nr:TIGR04283 family arsenosugar biosynthesis glycosyltransferase [Blastocatellia bacterium]
MRTVTVVVPVLDELRVLPETIARLRALAPPPDGVVFCDGGSTDGSRELLEKHVDGASMFMVQAPRGRGLQMNAGAALAATDIVLFLHADAWLPRDAIARVAAALDDDRVAGGAFTIAFARESRSPRSMPLIAAGINARTRATRTATGDQAIFATRKAFDRLEGFKPWPLFEDVDFVTRLKRVGRFVVLSGPVVLSDRRYAQMGPWRTTLRMWWLRVRYWLGHSPDDLKRAFVDVRRSHEE